MKSPDESLVHIGFIVLSNVTGTSLVKSLMMAVVGLIIGTIGIDPVSGDPRFTFGSVPLLGGIEFVAVAIGLFGIGEVLTNVDQPSEMLDQKVLARVRSGEYRAYYEKNRRGYMTYARVRFAQFGTASRTQGDSLAARLRAGVKAEAILRECPAVEAVAPTMFDSDAPLRK